MFGLGIMTEGEHTMVATHNFQRQLTDGDANFFVKVHHALMPLKICECVCFEQQYNFMSLNMFGKGINSDSHHNSRFLLNFIH